jgi:hypothetical protein
MATRRSRFSRRVPDHVTDELILALSEPTTYGFNDLFQVIYAKLKLKNAVSGGEEMLRLRAYEKLHDLVARGMVKKEARKFRGLEKLSELAQTVTPAEAK